MIKVKQLPGKQPKEKDKVVFLGSKTDILESFQSYFKNIHPKLIFLDLSMYFLDVRKEIHEEEKYTNKITQENEFTEELWQKFKKLLSIIILVIDEESFLAVKVNGSIKYHLKSILDEFFQIDNFVNEIIINSPYKIWYTLNSSFFERTNYILLYTKNPTPRINPVLNEKQTGGYWHSFVSKGQGGPKLFRFGEKEVELSPPSGTHWKLKQKTIFDLCAKGKIRLNSKGNPEYWVPAKKGQIIDTNWLDIPSYEVDIEKVVVNSSDLYTRLFSTCLKENDLVLDLSAGRGLSLAVAEKLKLKWVGIEDNKALFNNLIQKLEKKNLLFITYEVNSSYKFPSKNSSSSPLIEDNLSIHFPNPKKLSKPKSIERYGSTLEISHRVGTDEWINRLIFGDIYEVLPYLNGKLNKQIKMIYIDPPFFTGTNENIVIPIGLSRRSKDNTIDYHSKQIEELAYVNVLDSPNPIEFFKEWFKKSIMMMKPLLRDDGFIFIRFDYHFGHYAKIVLDEVFGSNNFVIEFLARRMKKNLSLKQAYRQTHLIVHSDSIFVYRCTEKAKLIPFTIRKRKRKGQDFAEIQYSNDNLWIDVAGYEKLKNTLYPTENSEALLSRIVKISTKKDDLIADFFCGSGTTVAVAEKLNRKWIGVDISHFAIHETKKRILTIVNKNPFEIMAALGYYHFPLLILKNITDQIVVNNTSVDQLVKRNLKNLLLVKLKSKLEKNQLKISIKDFTSNRISHISKNQDFVDYIDFWAIDWDYQDNHYNIGWYSFRKLKGKQVLNNIETTATYEYPKSGNYTVVLIFVDVFGNITRQSIIISVL